MLKNIETVQKYANWMAVTGVSERVQFSYGSFRQAGIELPDRRSLYFQVGRTIFLHHALDDSNVIGNILEQGMEIVRLHDMRSMPFRDNHVTLVGYCAVALCALEMVDSNGEAVLDLGSADGILSLPALKRSARKAYCIDCENYQSQLERHLQANGLPTSSMKFVKADLNRTHILDLIPGGDIGIVVANLGPHYLDTDINATRLIEGMPNVHHFVGGGYFNREGCKPDKVVKLLCRMGFKNPRYVAIDEHEQRTAFVVERK